MSEIEERAAIVAEARTWLGTPYHHGARIKGAGVDCGQLLIAVFSVTLDPGYYPHDWHMHRSDEKYLSFVEQYATRLDTTEDTLNARLAASNDTQYMPGDVLVFRVGRTFSHGAIVSQWPNIIHSYFPSSMVEEVSILGTPMAARPMRVYSYWRDR